MQFQRAPLPPGVEYFLDCANESDEMGAFAHAVLTLLGDRKLVPEMIDLDRGARRRGRWLLCQELDAYAHQLVRDLADHEQRAFVAADMRWEPMRLLRIAEYLAHFNFEDETRGGANLPFRRYCRHDRNFDPSPRARRRLYSPQWIRRYAKMEDQSVPMARAMADRLRSLPTAAPTDRRLIDDLRAEQREAQKFLQHEAARQTYREGLRQKFSPYPVLDKPQRRAIRRATEFASSVVGREDVATFVRGGTVRLRGPELMLEISRGRSLTTVGHGALDVRLCDTDGTRLANVCVFFDGTPALDQLAAVALHVEAGEAKSLISTGNLFAVTDAGAAHAIVRQRLAQNPAIFDEHGVADRVMRRGLRPSDYDRQMAALRRYKGDTMELYVGAVRTQVWGRDAHRLDPYIDDMTESALADIQNMRLAA